MKHRREENKAYNETSLITQGENMTRANVMGFFQGLATALIRAGVKLAWILALTVLGILAFVFGFVAFIASLLR